MKNKHYFPHVLALLMGISISVFLLGLARPALAVNLYWVGADGASTATASNWKTTDPASCGGGDASSAPSTTDNIFFDADCDNGAAINSTLSVSSITFASGYTGTVTQSAAITVTGLGWTMSGGTFTGGSNTIDINSSDLSISGGAFTSTSGEMTLGGSLSRTSGTFSHNNGTVTFDSALAQTLTGETFYNLNIANTAASPSDSIDVDSSAAVTVTNQLTVNDGQFQPTTGSDFSHVNINGAGGILKPDSGATITVSGNWSNVGTFTANSGTVTLDGTSQTITGATTFYNLSKTEGANNSTNESLTFTAGVTITISNTLTLDGRDSDDRISLGSSLVGSSYTLDVTGGAASVDYLFVTDSNASSNDITCSNCTNNGGNDDAAASPHWIFPTTIDIAGTVYSDEGSTPLTSKTVRIAVNGTDGTTTTSNGTTGAYSFTSVSVSSGDVVTLYLEDETQDAVTVTVVGSSNLSSVHIFQDRLITRCDNSCSLTVTNLGTAAVSAETDISNIYSSSGGTFTMASGKELFIPSSHTFTLASAATASVDDIDINGTFTMSTVSVDVAGTWDATGGSFTSSGTVTFSSTGSETIISDGDSFNNLTLSGSGGTFTLEDTLDVDGNLTISAGTLDTKSGENNAITLAGNWSRTSGSFTPRSGTVTFNGSGAQTLTGETFYNLTINNSAGSPGDSTDVDSSAAVTVTNTLTVTDGQFQPTTASDFVAVSIGAAGILKPDSGAAITVSGNWDKAGTFTANSGTVTFDGSSQQLNDDNTFYNLTKSISSTDTFTLEASVTQIITNVTTFLGTSGATLSLRSSSSDTQWKVDPQGTRSISYVDVKDSNNINATAVDCTNNCTNSNNNTNWTFASSGDDDGDDGDDGDGDGGDEEEEPTPTPEPTPEPTATPVPIVPTPTPEPTIQSCSAGSTLVGGVCVAGEVLPPEDEGPLPPALPQPSEGGQSQPEGVLPSLPDLSKLRDTTRSVLQQAGGAVAALGKALVDITPTAPQVTSVVAATAAAATAASSGLVSSLPSVAGNLWQLFQRIGQGIIGLAATRKRRPWGRVVDAISGNPIPQAIVRVLDRQTQHIKDTAVTDAKGEFASLLPAGEYRLQVVKQGWNLEPVPGSFFSKLSSEQWYDGNVVNVTSEKLVSIVIGMRAAAQTSAQKLVFKGFVQKIERVLAILSWPLLVIGFAFSATALYRQINWLNTVILGVYVILIALKYALQARTQKTVGYVRDAATGKPLELAMVQLFDADTSRQMASKVTTASGQFVLLPPPGIYTVVVSHAGYQQYRESHIVVRPEQQGAFTMTFNLTPATPQPMSVEGLAA